MSNQESEYNTAIAISVIAVTVIGVLIGFIVDPDILQSIISIG